MSTEPHSGNSALARAGIDQWDFRLFLLSVDKRTEISYRVELPGKLKWHVSKV